MNVALQWGFHGVGVYWNGECYSVHLDKRRDLAMWYAIKKAPGKEWKYTHIQELLQSMHKEFFPRKDYL